MCMVLVKVNIEFSGFYLKHDKVYKAYPYGYGNYYKINGTGGFMSCFFTVVKCPLVDVLYG